MMGQAIEVARGCCAAKGITARPKDSGSHALMHNRYEFISNHDETLAAHINITTTTRWASRRGTFWLLLLESSLLSESNPFPSSAISVAEAEVLYSLPRVLTSFGHKHVSQWRSGVWELRHMPEVLNPVAPSSRKFRLSNSTDRICWRHLSAMLCLRKDRKRLFTLGSTRTDVHTLDMNRHVKVAKTA
ncbi:hypothetical protein L209DRAFT_161324 [Thermothelomyces heterothallicus CBS 203.75]